MDSAYIICRASSDALVMSYDIQLLLEVDSGDELILADVVENPAASFDRLTMAGRLNAAAAF